MRARLVDGCWHQQAKRLLGNRTFAIWKYHPADSSSGSGEGGGTWQTSPSPGDRVTISKNEDPLTWRLWLMLWESQSHHLVFLPPRVFNLSPHGRKKTDPISGTSAEPLAWMLQKCQCRTRWKETVGYYRQKETNGRDRYTEDVELITYSIRIQSSYKDLLVISEQGCVLDKLHWCLIPWLWWYYYGSAGKCDCP